MHYSSRLLSSLPPIIASIFYTELDLSENQTFQQI